MFVQIRRYVGVKIEIPTIKYPSSYPNHAGCAPNSRRVVRLKNKDMNHFHKNFISYGAAASITGQDIVNSHKKKAKHKTKQKKRKLKNKTKLKEFLVVLINVSTDHRT